MSKPVRVMQIIDSMNFGGAEVLLRDLIRGLIARGYRVSARYNTPGPLAEDIRNMGVPVKRLLRRGRIDPFLLWQMRQEIYCEHPDVVHTHLFKSDIHGRLAARLAGVPVVVSTVHNCSKWAENPIMGKTYGLTVRFADEIIAVSEEVRQHAIRYFGVKPEKVQMIPNAIPLERFVEARALGSVIREEFGIPTDAPLIGIVGRLTEQKDHVNFLKAAAKIAEKVPLTRFLIAGDGPLRPALVNLAASLGLNDTVIFTGVRKDIIAIYGALDVLVISSKWEGMPVALLEGMAVGLPVVSTKVGGVPEVLEHEHTGLLVPPSDSNALAEACLSLIENPTLRTQMATAATKKVRSSYGMDAMIDATARLYDELLEKARFS